jgi:oxygen-independent coproporphyrinogen-3 oxidase
MQTPGNFEYSLYFHIPFCSKKCDYCHFFVLPNSQDNQKLLLKGLKLEWGKRSKQLKGEVRSVYFGGGTPSLMSLEALSEILSFLPPFSPDVEVTLEANPENLTLDALRSFRALGINRLSIGAQVFDDALLHILGRTHSASTTIQALEWARMAGFENISIDLMYDLPHQTLASWEKTLACAASLPITHLSLYNLTIEPETLFFKNRRKIGPHLPHPDSSLAMYQMALEHLTLCGLTPYEISAFARKGCYSRHNTGYWTARPFLGLGPSAYSFWEMRRFRNIPHLKKYVALLEKGDDPVDLYDTLPIEQRRKELLAVELRLRCGVCLSIFEGKHGSLAKDTYATLEQLKQKGWLQEKEGVISLTSSGVLFYDSVAVELI